MVLLVEILVIREHIMTIELRERERERKKNEELIASKSAIHVPQFNTLPNSSPEASQGPGRSDIDQNYRKPLK